MPAYIREQGRITGARMRALKTYTKRDWSSLKNNDVWVGDGHSLKMKVKHPDHGQPFVPELTLIMDTACRYIVGWSLSYAESCIAVADALRHAQHVFAGLVYAHGRGIIERVMKTLAHTIARQFETYHGPGADRDTVRQIHTATASLAKAQREGKQELTPKQAWAQGKLPSWDDLLKTVAAADKISIDEALAALVAREEAKVRTLLGLDAETTAPPPAVTPGSRLRFADDYMADDGEV